MSCVIPITYSSHASDEILRNYFFRSTRGRGFAFSISKKKSQREEVFKPLSVNNNVKAKPPNEELNKLVQQLLSPLVPLQKLKSIQNQNLLINELISSQGGEKISPRQPLFLMKNLLLRGREDFWGRSTAKLYGKNP